MEDRVAPERLPRYIVRVTIAAFLAHRGRVHQHRDRLNRRAVKRASCRATQYRLEGARAHWTTWLTAPYVVCTAYSRLRPWGVETAGTVRPCSRLCDSVLQADVEVA
jgi:hypothetical protein